MNLSDNQIVEYYQGIVVCCERYKEMLDKLKNIVPVVLYEGDPRDPLYVFITEVLEAARSQTSPLMKINRHLGYIQGCMIERGLTTVYDEREFTRHLFRHLDFG